MTVETLQWCVVRRDVERGAMSVVRRVESERGERPTSDSDVGHCSAPAPMVVIS